MENETAICPVCGVQAEKTTPEAGEKRKKGSKFYCPACGYSFWVPDPEL